MGFLKKIFGSHSDHELKRLYPIADKIEAMSDEYAALTDEQLRAKTGEFKQRYADGESLDDLLPEAFATAREAAWRVLGMKPFRVQLIGGIVLHQGRIAEMKTGEGKTLVAVLPAYLNALTGEGVHIVTVNDYLARRDSEWMGKVYRFLGLSVGLIVHDMSSAERQQAYAADITYGTNNEMGFDYLLTTWPSISPRWCSAATPSPSSTRWTPSSLMRRAPRSSSPVRATRAPTSTARRRTLPPA